MEDSATLETGALVATTQFFDLGDTLGSDMIVSDGFELIDIDTPFTRATTGGTEACAGANGVQTQTFLGLNDPDLVIGDIPLFGSTLAVELATS